MATYRSKTELGSTSGAKNQEPKGLCDAKQVTPRKSAGWSVLVQVVEKRKQKESRSCPGLWYKNYTLTDMQGTRIPAVTFGSNVGAVDRILFPYKRYFISNAGVRDARAEFRLGDYPYNWVLTYRTPMRLLEETIPHTLPCPFQFTDFSEMHRFADRDASIDFKALVIHSRTISGSGENAVREYVVINEENRPMIMRLWSDWLDNAEVQVSDRLPTPTIIVGLNMKVTTHNVVSLTTRSNGYLMVDPPLPGNGDLMNWYNENAEAIANLLELKAYRNTDYLVPPPADGDIIPIETVLSTIEIIKTAWVRATIHLIPGQETLWTTVCGKCHRGVDGPVGSNTLCNSCSEDIEIEPRSRYGVYLHDGVTTLEAILYSPDTEKLAKFTGKQAFEAYEKGSPLNNEIETLLPEKEAYCYLKYFDTEFGGRVVKKFPILKVYTVEEVSGEVVVAPGAIALEEISGGVAAVPGGIEIEKISGGVAAVPGGIGVEEISSIVPSIHDDIVETGNSVQLLSKEATSDLNEQQLFSPTTFNILDDIEKDLPQAEPVDAHGSTAKRALAFGTDLCDSTPPTPSTHSDLPAVGAAAPANLSESPAKKVKGRGKEKQN